MKPLILVKHSTPEIVESIPAREWHLSEQGRVRARALAELLSKYHPEAIVSSIEPKARETAQILAENLGWEYQVAEDLHEHDRSHVSYFPQEEFQAIVREFFEQPHALVFGEETARQAWTRFHAAVDVILKSHPEKTVVIVAHGTVISLFVSRLIGCDGHALWQKLSLPSFVVLDLQSKELLETVNLP